MHTVLAFLGNDYRACDDLLASAEADVWWPQQAMASPLSLALSALLPWGNLLSATRRFVRHGGRFT